jgi:regulator of sigma E protease
LSFALFAVFLNSTFSLLRFGLVLSLLVFVHELGHFLAAKWRKVAVEEFGFGLPPRLWGKKFRGTVYSLNLFPVGGFVKLKGEDPEVAGFGDADSFSVKSKKSRAAIIVAGVLGNLVLAWLIFSFLFAVGNPELSGRVQIEEVAPGSPAESAGLKREDIVVSVNNRAVKVPEDLILEVNREVGQEVVLQIDRQGQALQMRLVPRLEPPVGEGPLGVKIALVEPQVRLKTYPLWHAPFYGALELGRILKEMLGGMGSLVRSALSRQAIPVGVSGVVGIKALTDVAAEMGKRFFLQFVALLSLNLLIFNLLPIPALDGGRLLFVGLEAILRRKLNPKIEKIANNLGLAFLLLLFVLITIQDIERFW